MKSLLKVSGGFASLICGALITVLLPELGVPLMLIGTRLLGDRYAWAKRLNAKVDSGWIRLKSRLKRLFRK